MSCDQRAGSCPSYCGKNGYCCSGEDPNDPRSWLAKHGGNGNCPSGAVIAQQNRPDSFPGYACVNDKSELDINCYSSNVFLVDSNRGIAEASL